MREKTPNQKCINLFAELLDKEASADRLRVILSGLYFNYSRLLVKHGEDFGLMGDDADVQLYYLQLLIQIADPETDFPKYPGTETIYQPQKQSLTSKNKS